MKTNSFGANALRLARHGFEHRVSEINWTAAQLALEVAKESRAYVAGSVGPLGGVATNAADLYLEQIGALLDGGARIILLETFTDLDELSLALNAKHTLHHCPVIASIVCRPDGRLFDGSALEAAFARLREAGADVVAINCTACTPALIEALPAPDQDLPLAVMPSAGVPAEHGGRLEYPVQPWQFGRDAVSLARAGARMVGGCCGAGPAHIAALTAALAEAGLISSS